MKHILFIMAILTFVSFTIYSQSIPKQISYQGVLKNATGVNVPDGSYSLVFKIYNELTGGTALWTETQNLNVKDGLFSTQLGSVTPITNVPFDRIQFLGLTIGTGSELTPRTVLTPSPYSFMSMSILDSTISTAKLQEGAVVSSKIGTNEVVKSLNGLKDDVNLVAGSNITITPSGNNITINGAGSGSGTVTQVNTGAGLTGGPITTTGTISVANDGITTVMLQNNSVTSTKIVDGTITATDIGSSQVVKSLNSIKDNVNLVAGSNITITPSGQNITITSTAGGIGGSGTSNYLPKFTNSTTLGNSGIYQSGSNLGIGTTSPSYPLTVQSSPTLLHVIQSEYTGTTTEDGVAVYGKSVPTDYYGIGGYFVGGYVGIVGEVIPSGSNNYYGVRGGVSGGTSPAGNRYGVYGIAGGTGTGFRYAIYGTAAGGTTNWAGYFSGNVRVTGIINPTAANSKIDHPLDPANKYLYHSFVESPDMMNIYNGNVVTDGSGYATITLPDWFEALNKDFRYQLTVIGDFAQAIIAQKIQNNQFAIRTDKPNIEVSWQVTGIRKDAWAEKNRIPVEEMKQGDEVGKYIHPDAFSLPETMSIDYEKNNPETEKASK